jgi:hypothetical protein
MLPSSKSSIVPPPSYNNRGGSNMAEASHYKNATDILPNKLLPIIGLRQRPRVEPPINNIEEFERNPVVKGCGKDGKYQCMEKNKPFETKPVVKGCGKDGKYQCMEKNNAKQSGSIY